MSEEKDPEKKEENENIEKNEEDQHKKKKKKKKKKTEEKNDKEEDDDKDTNNNQDITRNNFNNNEKTSVINNEALSNIPSKEVPRKKKKKKTHKKENNEIKEENETKEADEPKEKNEAKEIDINDILNNNNENNGGDLMITELLGVEGQKKKKKKKKHEKDNENNENENITEIVNEEKTKIDKKSKYLEDKLKSLEVDESIKEGINTGIAKSNEDLREDIKNDKLAISKKVLSDTELQALSKSLENIIMGNNNVFLTGVNKFDRKTKIKNLRFLKTEEQILRKNIAKLNQSQQLIENTIPLKANIIENNIRKNKLKDISKSKDELMSKLEKINQKIEILLNEEKLRQKNNRHNLTEIMEYNSDDNEKFNSRLLEMQKNEEKLRQKYQEDLQKAINKKKNDLDTKEKNLQDLKEKLLKDAKKNEKEIFLRRKNEINEKLEKTKKYINEKIQKTEKDYLFFKYQEDFEKKEQKLIDKVNMAKKDPLVTQEEIKELAEKIEKQKQYLQDNAEERKKQMQQLWNYRSQTLPTYRHPLAEKMDEELLKKLNDEEEEKRRKECNQLEKINYKPPKVTINTKLKKIREKRINPNNKEIIIETELNNKKRLNVFRYTPVKTNKNPIIKDERSLELNHNNFINFNEVKNNINIKNKNKLKPIQILHPKPERPIDNLKELHEKRNKSTDGEKKRAINFDDLFNGDIKNNNIIESIEVAKIRTSSIDKIVERKKEMMKSNGGYLKNPYLASEIGDLLVESITAKLKLMNKLGGEEE